MIHPPYKANGRQAKIHFSLGIRLKISHS